MSITEQLTRIKRGTNEIIAEDELSSKLLLGRPLRIKLGVDPTSPFLHLGHTVILNKLRIFQDMGHKVIFIIGDLTARIGDPSGRDETRPCLSEKDILENSKTYQEQVFKILDRSKTEIVFNSQWLYPLGLDGLLDLARRYTVARMLERDDFNERYRSRQPITILEFLYPLLQGYDSVAIKADVEFGGTDQKFNLLVGRELQREFGQEPQVIITMPLLEGTDGVKKMSKSYGNVITLNDSPAEMFGKVMSISDDTMWNYYKLLTEEDIPQLNMHPKEVKLRLAEMLVARFYENGIANKTRGEFEAVFSGKQYPDDMAQIKLKKSTVSPVDLIIETGLAKSKNEARRLINEGAVELDGKKITMSEELRISMPIVLKVGKHRFAKIIPYADKYTSKHD